MSTTKTSTLVTAKVNINFNLFFSSLEEGTQKIAEAILGHTANDDIRSGDFVWGFRAVKSIDLEERRHRMIGGKMFKMRARELAVVTDEDVDTETVPNFAEGVSHFVFDPKTEIIAFEDRRSVISVSAFCRMFAQLVSSNDQELAHAISVYPKPEKGAFLSFIKSGTRLKTVRFEISPANGPVNWGNIEDELKRTGSTRMKREYHADAGNLIVDGTEIETFAQYADNGWANASGVIEEADGTVRRRGTKDLTLRVTIEYNGEESTVLYKRIARFIVDEDDNVSSGEAPSDGE